MRIVIISHSHPRFTRGGAEISAYRSFSHLRSLGIEVYFFGALRRHETEIANVFGRREILEIDQNEFVFRVDDFDDFWHINLSSSSVCLFDKIVSIRPDVVHAHHFWNVGWNVLNALRSTKFFIMAITLHEYLAICFNFGQMVKTRGFGLCHQASAFDCAICFPARMKAAFESRKTQFLRSLSAFDVVISPSEFLARRFSDWGLESEIHILENFCPPSINTAETDFGYLVDRFAFFGQITPFKGVDIFLSAALVCIQSGRRNLRFDIFGLSTREFLEIYGESWQIPLARHADQIAFRGRYSPHESSALMAQHGWIVVPSIWWENSPVVIQEAFNAGRPVLCSAIGGMKEKVESGRSGYCFRVGDSGDLARTMLQCISNQSHWQVMVDYIRNSSSFSGQWSEDLLSVFRKKLMALSSEETRCEFGP